MPCNIFEKLKMKGVNFCLHENTVVIVLISFVCTRSTFNLYFLEKLLLTGGEGTVFVDLGSFDMFCEIEI